ncbi:unnamed protein product [Lactuca virosa]|uniref:Uncharacterized protein n=1 Tax=Lactuca virosa TaxID=75947 RepID=A0AAU9M034_9ASTR|nr:unnamed protein product [Lactuca virosa]
MLRVWQNNYNIVWDCNHYFKNSFLSGNTLLSPSVHILAISSLIGLVLSFHQKSVKLQENKEFLCAHHGP